MKRLKQRNPVYTVKKMARPEHMAGIGYQLMHVREGIRAALLGQILQHAVVHATPENLESFTKFYEEMLVGMDATAREAGAQPKTVDDLRTEISKLSLPEAVERICMSLTRLMEPPEPLEL